jgi:hypothetical protein
VTQEGLKKRVEQLEEKSGVHAIDVVMWTPIGGGVFGHIHVIGKRKTPCSDEEEVAIMRADFEKHKHRIGGKGEEVKFEKYLETFTYLGPDGLAERQRTIIDKLKGS